MPLAALIGPLRLPRGVLDRARPRRRPRSCSFGVNVLVAGHRRAGRRLRRSSRAGARRCGICVDALADGAKNALPVGIACAIVGVVIGTLTLTGIASTFIGAIIAIGQDNLFLSLVLTMLTCLVLGMGIPTIPNYIITSSLAGPALLELGVPLIVSHMFVFYFGIMADLTPPVALAAFAAAPMAKVSGMKIARAGHQARGRRVRRAVHGGLHAGADAAGRRRRSPRASATRSRSSTSCSRPASASRCGARRSSASCSAGRSWERALAFAAGAALLLRSAADRRDRLFAGRAWFRPALVADPRPGIGRRRHDACASPAGGTVLALAVDGFTLSWTHSVTRRPVVGKVGGQRRRPSTRSRRASAAAAPGWSRPKTPCWRTMYGPTT